MNADIKIIQVLNTGKSSDQHGLVFKVKWDNSDEFAYIQFDVAKKKYPSIVLDYLIARIKQKPINQPHKQIQQPQLGMKADLDLNTVCKINNQQKKIGKLHNKSDRLETKNNSIKCQREIDKNCKQCLFCYSRNGAIRMLDYDAIVSIDSAIAYPTYFKLKKEKAPNNIKKSVN